MDETNINALVQSIERSLHLIYKNIFSIKQYQFPPKIGLNLFKESRPTSPLCVRRRLRLYIYPRRPEVMVGRDREWRAYRDVCGQWGEQQRRTLTVALKQTSHDNKASRLERPVFMKTSLPVEKRLKKTGKVIERMKPTLERFDNSNYWTSLCRMWRIILCISRRMLSSGAEVRGGYKHPPSLTVVRRSLARSMSIDIFFLVSIGGIFI